MKGSVEMDTNDPHRDAPGGTRRRLRRLRFPAYLVVAGIAAAAAVFASIGSAAQSPSLLPPNGLQTFLDPERPGAGPFPRTPAFRWNPVRGATRYEFELSTSSSFRAGSGLIWSGKTLSTPAVSVPVALPWLTGAAAPSNEPGSLHWRVRAVGPGGDSPSPWSDVKSFTMRWVDEPTEWKVDRPGYVRWHPVDGATAYQVWFTDIGKVITTITNVADEREFYAFHNSWAINRPIRWRVRALRAVYGQAMSTIPAVSYGPWSDTYVWWNTTDPLTPSDYVTPFAAVSGNQTSTPSSAVRHELMPGVLFSGDGPTNHDLHRAYVFSDEDCVNVVYRGPVVGGPAYAPRSSGPLNLPTTLGKPDTAGTLAWALVPGNILRDGTEGTTGFTVDTAPVKTSEELPGATASSAGKTSTTSANPTSVTSSGFMAGLAKVDLWDRDWPKGHDEASKESEGVYYWAVVPVNVVVLVDGKVEYHDTELPQDACRAGHVVAFGKQGIEPNPTKQATGLSANGRLLSAGTRAASFYGPPLVTWMPATAAVSYEVEWARRPASVTEAQWSRVPYPWNPAGHLETPATSALLPLSAKGEHTTTWWYRVRGINESVPGNQKMRWSNPVRIRIAPPTLSIMGG